MRSLSNALRLFTASSTLLAIGIMAAPMAQASSYYNCNTPHGCSKIDSTDSHSDYGATKYPIVMAHGFLGWNRLLNTLDYFNGVPQVLMKNGTTVFTTKTSSVNSSEVRGEQLLQQVRTIEALMDSGKVNLVGHSQGGFDSRYVATVAADKIASVTTVSTPHQGTKTADFAVETLENDNTPNKFGTKVFEASLVAVGLSLDALSAVPLDQLQEQNVRNVAATTSTASNLAFNKKYPAPIPSSYCGMPPTNNVLNGVGYYSWSGSQTFTNALDPSDYLLTLLGKTHEGEANDGFVTPCSSRVGFVIRDDYRMNHLDSINQLLGMTSWRETNPLTVYRNHVNRLKNAGY
ncbi:esterase/lipase family protein [Psychrobacter pygoscelis]|uniref:esterase/lipase family protein n=1 Tax=Psychrobacter pygoscelis TaxID=2488563 RepID=UPI00103A869A|nr:triacylglycerol lipase [Psychrobacter pygoscelis]